MQHPDYPIQTLPQNSGKARKETTSSPWANKAWQHSLFHKPFSVPHLKTHFGHIYTSLMHTLSSSQCKASGGRPKSKLMVQIATGSKSLHPAYSSTLFLFQICSKTHRPLTLVWHKESSLVSGGLSNMFPRSRLAPNSTLPPFLSSHNFNSKQGSSPQQTDARGWGLTSACFLPPGPL